MGYFELCLLPDEQSQNIVFTIPPVGQLIGKSMRLTYDGCKDRFPFRHLCVQSLDDAVKINQHTTFAQDNECGELGNLLSNSSQKIPLGYTHGFKLIYFLKKDLEQEPKNVKLTYYIESGEPESDIIDCDTETLYCFDIVSSLTGRNAGYEMKQIPAKMTFRKNKTASLLVEEWLLRQYQQQHREEQRRIRALLPRNPYTI